MASLLTLLSSKQKLPTIHMWLSTAEESQEATPSSARVRHHLQHHQVGGGDESPGPERSAEAAQLLHRVRVTVVHVHVVIATGRVSLQVEDTELEHDHLTLWNL